MKFFLDTANLIELKKGAGRSITQVYRRRAHRR
jgi:hypothetical protein